MKMLDVLFYLMDVMKKGWVQFDLLLADVNVNRTESAPPRLSLIIERAIFSRSLAAAPSA